MLHFSPLQLAMMQSMMQMVPHRKESPLIHHPAKTILGDHYGLPHTFEEEIFLFEFFIPTGVTLRKRFFTPECP